jgi:purine-binding chemotaxis protein CheW
MQVLTFSISDLRLGVAITDVVEAVRAVEITPLPGAPTVVEGLIDFRGAIAPVFDLRLRLLGSHADITPDHRLIMARSSNRLVALHVDTVDELVDLDSAAIQPAESQTSTTAHIAGIAARPDGLLLIHDLATFLSAAERDTLDAALDTAAVAQ